MGDFSTGGVIKGFSLKIDMRTTVTKVASKSEPGIGSFDSSLNSTLAARSHLVKARSSRLSTSKQFYVKVSMENVALIYYLGYLPRIQASRHA